MHGHGGCCSTTTPIQLWDQDGVHDIYRGWRAVADQYAPQRIFIAEAWVPSNERLARYLRPDELHTAFHFDFLRAPWRASSLRTVIDEAIDAAASVGAPPTWVLSNHDVPRTVTRYSRSQPTGLVESDWERARWAEEDADHELGRRRARACALLQLALPGTAYVYQGEELGLEEIEDLPDEVRQDPTWAAVRFHRRRPRRLPCAASMVGFVCAVRFFADADDHLATAAGPLGCAHRGRPGRRPGLFSEPVPRGPGTAPPGVGGRR